VKISAVIHNALIAGIQKLSLAADITYNPITAVIALGNYISSLKLSDAASSLDEIAFAFFKQLSDDSAAVDEAVIAFGKVIEDSSDVTDAAVLELLKAVADSAASADDVTLTVGKNVNDTAATSEALVFATEKYLSDIATATDDLDGEASTLDDQTLFFTKVRSEAAFVSEVFARVVQYFRSFDETPAAADSTARTVFKVLSDVVEAVDTLDAELIINESAVDAGGVSESLAVVLEKVLTETPAAVDSIAAVVTKPLADSGATSDQFTVLFSTARVDSGYIADNTLKLPIKSLSESGNVSDAGSYRGQGYSDFDYFAEDYVGYSGVF
jgi:hypothetical protein